MVKPRATAVDADVTASARTASLHADDESPADVRRWRAVGLHSVALVLIVLSAGLVLFNTGRSSNDSTNVMSRWATVEALVHYRTYSIDETKYTGTIDKVKIGERFYSSKPPLLPTLVAGIYGVYYAVTGDEIGTRGSSAAWVCKVATMLLAHVVLLVWFFRFAHLLMRRQEAVLVSLAAICFGFIGAGYATTLNNHSPAAALALVAFYYAYRVRHGIDARNRHWVVAGLAAGALPAIDLPSLAISAAILLYLLPVDRKRTLTLFLPAMVPFILIHQAITFGITGSLMPIYMRSEYYQYPGSFWLNPRGIHALREPLHVYAFNVLLGHHGLFTMTPLFVLALLALFRDLRGRGERFPEAVLVSACGVVLLGFYLLRTHNYGGICVGVRWLVAYMPFLFLFVGAWMDQARLRKGIWVLVLALLVVSQFNAMDALDTPWKEGAWDHWWRSLTEKP